MSIWKTSIEETETQLSGPFRAPQQMLAEQEYDGHLSIHDDSKAESLGIKGAPIEGPPHFSQFEPLLHKLGEDDWFRFDGNSNHFQAMDSGGKSVKEYAERTNTD